MIITTRITDDIAFTDHSISDVTVTITADLVIIATDAANYVELTPDQYQALREFFNQQNERGN